MVIPQENFQCFAFFALTRNRTWHLRLPNLTLYPQSYLVSFFLYSVGKVPEGVVSHNSTSNLKFLNQFLHSRVPMIGQVAPFSHFDYPLHYALPIFLKFLVENGKVWSVKAYSCWTIISRFSNTFWITRAKISSDFPPPIHGVPWSLRSCTHSKTHTHWNSILLVHIRSHILWCIYFLTL